jgi:hypothetical protein
LCSWEHRLTISEIDSEPQAVGTALWKEAMKCRLTAVLCSPAAPFSR